MNRSGRHTRRPTWGLPTVMLGLLVCAAGRNAAAAVFGEDDRRGLTPAQMPIAANIGQIVDKRDQAICTAFCVGARTVATAAHCLGGAAGPIDPANFRFRLESAPFSDAPQTYRQSRLAAPDSGDTASRSFVAGTRQLKLKPPIDSAHDWALARLEEPICTAGGLRLSSSSSETVTARAEDFPVFNFAYHSDIGRARLMVSGNCEVGEPIDEVSPATIAREFADPANLLLHRCDTAGASSGSPMLVSGAFGPEVVAINVGTYMQSKVVMTHGNVAHRLAPEAMANTAASVAPIAAALAEFDADEPIADAATQAELRMLLDRALALQRSAEDTFAISDLKSSILAFERLRGMTELGVPTRRLLTQLRREVQPFLAGGTGRRPPVQETGSTR